MATQSFKDWIIDNQNLAEQRKKELENDIQLEKEIIEENKKIILRRSARINKSKNENEINKAYNAYLRSIDIEN